VKKVRVGVLGLGSWGTCHLEAYASLPQVEVVAACDAREERLRELQGRFQVSDWSVSDEDLWERDDIDLVSVVTPEESHLRPVLNALESGKHVVVEKPVASKAGEAREMWKTALDNGRYIAPGHLLRFEPRYAQLQHLLKSGEIGNLVSLYLKRGRPRSLFETYQRVHTVFELTVHDIDLAIWYTGSRVKSVKAYERSITGARAPDIVWAWLEFESGVLATLQSHWMTPDEAGVEIADSTELTGEKGLANFDTSNTGPQLWSKAGRLTPELHHHHLVNGRVTGALRETLGYVCDCIAKHEELSYLSFEDAIHGVEVAEAIRESAKTGREIGLIQTSISLS
jgi:UDP-N-acetylglucosamine 3-dehydrogenase